MSITINANTVEKINLINISFIFIILLIMFVGITGCAVQKLSTISVNKDQHEVKTIAMGLDGEATLSDALVVELERKGYKVVDRVGVYKIIKESGKTGIFTNDKAIISHLKSRKNENKNNIDAFLTTKMIELKADGSLDNVTVFLYSARSGDELLSFKWTNGRTMLRFTIVEDNALSKDMKGAAEDIVTVLIKNLN